MAEAGRPEALISVLDASQSCAICVISPIDASPFASYPVPIIARAKEKKDDSKPTTITVTTRVSCYVLSIEVIYWCDIQLILCYFVRKTK